MKNDILSYADDSFLDSAKADFDKRKQNKKNIKFSTKKILIPIAASLAVVAAAGGMWKAGVFTNIPETADVKPVVTEAASAPEESVTEEIYEIQNAESDAPDILLENVVACVEPDTVTVGDIAEESSSGYSPEENEANYSSSYSPCLILGEDETAQVLPELITAPDTPSYSDSAVFPSQGEWFISPGITETVKNHEGEYVVYRLRIKLVTGGGTEIVTDEQTLKAEADRLFFECRALGLDNCIFEFSTYNDGMGGVKHELYANIYDTGFFENFPASSEYGYIISFINEYI